MKEIHENMIIDFNRSLKLFGMKNSKEDEFSSTTKERLLLIFKLHFTTWKHSFGSNIAREVSNPSNFYVNCEITI